MSYEEKNILTAYVKTLVDYYGGKDAFEAFKYSPNTGWAHVFTYTIQPVLDNVQPTQLNLHYDYDSNMQKAYRTTKELYGLYGKDIGKWIIDLENRQTMSAIDAI